MDKKIILGSLAGLALLTAMAGCGTVSSSSNGNSATTSTPISAKITMLSNTAGIDDRLVGVAGAAENNSIVKVYNSGVLKFLAVSNSDGSFNFPVGDDVVNPASLTATAAGKAESSAISKTNPPQ